MDRTPKRKPKRPDVGLDSFRMDLHAKVDAFAEMWRANHEKNPADWPLEFRDGALESGSEQWADQFRAWMGWDE